MRRRDLLLASAIGLVFIAGLVQAGVLTAAWPKWSGPKSLGPAKPLPALWCVQCTKNYKPGRGYLILVNSRGEWSDETIRKTGTNGKGVLTAAEFKAVKETLGRINWEALPMMSEKEYTAYHLGEKGYLGPKESFTGYTVDYWAGQTHTSPWYKGRRIVWDGKAPVAPEAKALIETMKPLIEKYIPPQE